MHVWYYYSAISNDCAKASNNQKKRRSKTMTTKKQIKEQLWKMVEQAIAEEDYSIMREAFQISYENDVEMIECDDYVMVEDERFDFNGAF
jgi:hypothetical protein